MSNRLRTTTPDDRFFRRVFGVFGAWFAFVAILALAVTGVFIWAVILLVNHFAG